MGAARPLPRRSERARRTVRMTRGQRSSPASATAGLMALQNDNERGSVRGMRDRWRAEPSPPAESELLMARRRRQISGCCRTHRIVILSGPRLPVADPRTTPGSHTPSDRPTPSRPVDIGIPWARRRVGVQHRGGWAGTGAGILTGIVSRFVVARVWTWRSATTPI